MSAPPSDGFPKRLRAVAAILPTGSRGGFRIELDVEPHSLMMLRAGLQKVLGGGS
jgi:hypothetical protein